MNILIAEDDVRLGRLLVYMLQTEGYTVDLSTEGEDAFTKIEQNHYDLALLDWMLPGLSGLEICRMMRENGILIPVLMLTARDKVADRVAGLDAGADDYVIKPFEFDELLARVRSLLRRNSLFTVGKTIQTGDILLDPIGKNIIYQGRTIQLSNREFQLVKLLLLNRGRVVSREILLYRVWGEDCEVSENNLDSHIHLLRKKLDQPGKPSLITNVRGIGYKIEKCD